MHNKLRFILFGVLFLSILVFSSAVAPYASAATRRDAVVPTVTLTPLSGKVGDWIQGYGQGWPRGGWVDIYWENGGPVASVTPNSNGDFLAYFKVPAGLSPGPHQVWFDASDGTSQHITVYKTFQVTATSTATVQLVWTADGNNNTKT